MGQDLSEGLTEFVLPHPGPEAGQDRDQRAEPRFDAAFRASLADLLRWRRDVRRFLPTPLAPGLLSGLLELANLSPSVGLSQPWRFVLVEDPSRRAAIRADFLRCNAAAALDQPPAYAALRLAGLDTAPCHLALFADPEPAQGRGLGRATMPETAAWSAVLAAHTLWLAARAAGLGLGWVSILDPAIVAATLDVPTAWRFIGYLCLGHPAAVGNTPELERAGWERRRPLHLLHR